MIFCSLQKGVSTVSGLVWSTSHLPSLQEMELQRVLNQHGDNLAAGAAAVHRSAPQYAKRLGLSVDDSAVVTVMEQVRGFSLTDLCV